MIWYVIPLAALFAWLLTAARLRRAATAEDFVPLPGRVLVLSASVGGGHDAAARALGGRLEESGLVVTVEDGLRAMSPALEVLLRRGYMNQARGSGRMLAFIFGLTSQRACVSVVRTLCGLLYAGRLRRLLLVHRPEMVISTYPLVTQALGKLRRRNLAPPVIAAIADYGVHPLWVHPDVDLHLVVSKHSAELVRQAGGRAEVVRFPVRPDLHQNLDRREARKTLKLPPEGRLALIVGGAWGIGDLETAARCVVGSGVHTVVVTGKNTALKERLGRAFSGRRDVTVFGWREDMPLLMAASDVLVQNAGGMTCLEAREARLPIVMFDPVPGHGEFNALAMERAGAALWPRTAEELVSILESGTYRELRAPEPSRNTDPEDVLREIPRERPLPTAGSTPLRPVLAPLFALGMLVWLVFASPGAALAVETLHLKIPGYDPPPGEMALGIETSNPATASAAESFARRHGLPLTIFVRGKAGEGLVPAHGVNFGLIARRGEGITSPWRSRAALKRTAEKLRRERGIRVRYLLPVPRTNLASLATAPRGMRPVAPEKPGMVGNGLVVIDASGMSPRAAREALRDAMAQAKTKGLECVPLGKL